MISEIIVGILTISSLLHADVTDQKVQRGFAYLKLGCPENGLNEIRTALQAHPNSASLQEIYIRLLAGASYEKESIEAWKRYENSFQNEPLKRELLEEISWGIIRKGFSASLLPARIFSIVGANYTNDAYAIPLIKAALCDSNWLIRRVGVEFSSQLLDRGLQQQILTILRSDPSWEVRVHAIEAIGRMQLLSAEPILKEMLAVQKTLDALERAMIVQTLCMIKDKPEISEIRAFAKSNRAGLRLLACALAAEFEKPECADVVFNLIQDDNCEVRVMALSALAMLRKCGIDAELIKKRIAPCMQDLDYRVSITASYLFTLLGLQEGRASLVKGCFHQNEEVRRFSAAALASCGGCALQEMIEVLEKSQDPLVKVQLSIALIGQRAEVDKAAKNLFSFLQSDSSLLMWDERSHPLFKMLCPTELRHSCNEMDAPEAVDIQTRLELLRMLAILQYPQTIDLLKKFLKEKNFGVILTVSQTLIAEGGDEDVEIIKKLLTDPDLKIRVQAALVLGVWRHDKEAIEVLQTAYQDVNRDLKLKILEIIGHIGAKKSVPFLLEKMQDPYQVVRIFAASALIKCLNH